MIKLKTNSKRKILKGAWPVRGVAAATVLYSVAITTSPKLLAKPCGLTDADGRVPADAAALIRAIGTRDVALASLLFLSPTGAYMNWLTGARVAADAADAVWFYGFIPHRQRPKLVGVALGWALLQLAVDTGFNSA